MPRWSHGPLCRSCGLALLALQVVLGGRSRSAMVVQTWTVVGEGIVSAEELDAVFAQLLDSPGWSEFKTKTTRRMCDQYTFDGVRDRRPPPHLRFLHALVGRLVDGCVCWAVDGRPPPKLPPHHSADISSQVGGAGGDSRLKRYATSVNQRFGAKPTQIMV